MGPQMIIADSIKMVYRINNICKPRAMTKYFTFTNALYNNIRTPSIEYKPNLARTCKLQLFKGSQYYNNLLIEIRLSNNKTFNNKLKRYIALKTSVYKGERPVT